LTAAATEVKVPQVVVKVDQVAVVVKVDQVAVKADQVAGGMEEVVKVVVVAWVVMPFFSHALGGPSFLHDEPPLVYFSNQAAAPENI